ncbi:MAG TPA: hypothetical protein VML75_17675 [Kofleriaceae bacterium]|nr:hypothetical protein [Kofleriaceae bacterium]
MIHIYRRTARASLLAAALSLAACADAPDPQRISGRISQSSFHAQPLGVRAVQDGAVVAHTRLGADGSFALDVPEGRAYRLEVVTAGGVLPFVVRDAARGTRTLAFDVCAPGQAVDLGMGAYWEGTGVPDGGGGSSGGGSSDPGMPCDHPDDPNCGCGDPEPWPCEDPNDPSCTDPPPPPCEDPMDPNCDPCLENPEWCQDPCLENPEWCQDPCDNGQMDPEYCWPPPPPCDENVPDGMDGCWWDDPVCPMDDPNCWPQPEPPYCEDTPDSGPSDSDPNNDGQWMDPYDPGTCWDEPDDGCMVETPPPSFGCQETF